MFYLVGALFYTFVYALVFALLADEKWEFELFGGAALIWFLSVLVWPFSLVGLTAWGLAMLIKGKKNDKVSLKK